MNTALPNPFIFESVVVEPSTDRTAAASSPLSPTESAAATRFVLDEDAFMAALLDDDLPLFLNSPSFDYLEAVAERAA